MAGTQSGKLEVHLDVSRMDEIDAVARATDRDRQGVFDDALNVYLSLHRWQIAEIHEGLRQARAGEFVSDEEVARVFRRGL